MTSKIGQINIVKNDYDDAIEINGEKLNIK